MKCGGFAGGTVHHLDSIRYNISRYFVETRFIYLPVRYPWGWNLESFLMPLPKCFYLGTYTNYWNYPNQRIVHAHNLMTPEVAPMGATPIMYDYTSLIGSFEARRDLKIEGTPVVIAIPETYKNDRETMEFFHGKYNTDHYFFQKAALDARIKAFKECSLARYGPVTKAPQTTVPTPKGLAEFPGIPIEELTKPTPEQPSGGPEPPPKLRLRATLILGIKVEELYNALDLMLTIVEVK